MSSTANQLVNFNQNVNAQLLEKVITTNDLGGLSPIEKVEHIKNVCHSLGLNPLTKPIQLLKFQGKEIAYFTKDATEQLRKTNKVSITNVDTKVVDGLYIVTVYAALPDGRTDASTGATSITGLKGDALCNAMLKAETKAKRRVTLSICGLGFIDESEADSIPNSRKVALQEVKQIETIDHINVMIMELSESKTLDELEAIFKNHYKTVVQARDQASLKLLIDAKDKKKEELTIKEYNDELETEEVIS